MLVSGFKYEDVIDYVCRIRGYSDDLFYATGQTGFNPFHLKEDPNIFYWASEGKIKTDDGGTEIICLGYMSYKINFKTRSVEQIIIMSFRKGNIQFLKDVINKIKELMDEFDRIEFSVISGNPVERHYDKFVEEHGGIKYTYHNSVMDNHGVIRDFISYEIITKQKKIQEV